MTAASFEDRYGRLRIVQPSGSRTPVLILGLLIALYVAVFGVLTWRQQSRFATFGFDMGIYDQGIWLLSRGKEPFLTVRGLNYFGHHVNPITVLFVPFYWLGAGPHFLYAVETLWMALGAVPVYLMARDRLGGPWAGLAIGAAFLLHPSLEWINWWHFHPDALSITPFLFAWWFALHRRWRWFAAAVAVTLLCKEDAALAVLMLGLVLAGRNRQDRRVGLLTAAVGLVWFLVATRVVIPLANGGVGPFYDTFFPGLGNGFGEIVVNSVRHPSRLWTPMFQADRLTYYVQLLAPVALLALIGFPALLMAGPQVLVNVVSGHAYTYEIKYHYSSLVVATIFIATVEGVARVSRRRVGLAHGLCGVVLLAAVIGNVALSPSPIGTRYGPEVWAGSYPAHEAQVRGALRQVPSDAGVSAVYYLVPQLTQRVHIYEWPNPWVQANWGVRGERPPSTRTVDWLVVDTRLLERHQALYKRLTSRDGEFRIVYSRGNLEVSRRR